MNFISLKSIIIVLLILAILKTLKLLLIYKNYKSKYGNKIAQQMYKKIIRGIKPFVPSLNSKRYQTTELLLERVGWHRLGVEYFYVIKIFLATTTVLFLLLTTLSNNKIIIQQLVANIDIGKSIDLQQTSKTPEKIQLEEALFVTFSEIYKNNPNISRIEIENKLNDFLNINQITIEEEVDDLINRMLLKISLIEGINNGNTTYIQILIIALLIFHVPDILAYLKLALLENKKTWDAVYCMMVYSIFGKMPPYKIDLVIKNMELVSEFYQFKLIEFEQLLRSNDEESIETFIKQIKNEDFQEVLEMLNVSKRTGLLETVSDVEEMYSNSLDWIQVTNKRKRQFKYSLCLIPLTIIFLLLLLYFQYGMNEIMNSGMGF